MLEKFIFISVLVLVLLFPKVIGDKNESTL